MTETEIKNDETQPSNPVHIFYTSVNDGEPELQTFKDVNEARVFIQNLVSGSSRYLVHAYIGEPIPISNLLPPGQDNWIFVGGD